MFGQGILCNISEGTSVIPHKILPTHWVMIFFFYIQRTGVMSFFSLTHRNDLRFKTLWLLRFRSSHAFSKCPLISRGFCELHWYAHSLSFCGMHERDMAMHAIPTTECSTTDWTRMFLDSLVDLTDVFAQIHHTVNRLRTHWALHLQNTGARSLDRNGGTR